MWHQRVGRPSPNSQEHQQDRSYGQKQRDYGKQGMYCICGGGGYGGEIVIMVVVKGCRRH